MHAVRLVEEHGSPLEVHAARGIEEHAEVCLKCTRRAWLGSTRGAYLEYTRRVGLRYTQKEPPSKDGSFKIRCKSL